MQMNWCQVDSSRSLEFKDQSVHLRLLLVIYKFMQQLTKDQLPGSYK